jgi:hypothetical protein
MPELRHPERASLPDFVRTSLRGFAQALMGRNGRLLRAVFHAAHFSAFQKQTMPAKQN